MEGIFCLGDIAGYGSELEQTLELITAAGCSAIVGNHDLWHMEDCADTETTSVDTFFKRLPLVLELTIEGKRLYMVHASPPRSTMEGIKLLDERGAIIPERKQHWSGRLRGFAYDVLVVGHTHQVFAERLADTLVINPGSTKFNHSCTIMELPSLQTQVLPLSDRGVVRSWNWGADQIAKSAQN